MNIDKAKVQEAKEKLGERNAEIMVELLDLKDYNKRDKKACCPFHREDSASFVYDQKHHRFRCFGECQQSYDIIDILMKKGETYIGACRKLFEYADIEYSFGEEGVKTKAQYKYPHDENGDMTKVYEYWGKRGISKETLDYLEVGADANGNTVFKYFDTNNVLTMVKYRPSESIKKDKNEKKRSKNWCQKGSDTTQLLWNMNRVNPSQPLLIVEGEGDAMSAVEAGFLNTVSVPLGAGNFEWIEVCWDFLEMFDSIIIASDNDAAGEKMRKELIYRLGSWRTRTVTYPKEKITEKGNRIPIKDMNDTLQAFKSSYVMSMIVNAKDTPVDSVVDFSDVEDIDISTIDGILTGIKEFDQELMRLFYGTFNIVTGVNGSGKSSFLGQLTCSSIEQGKDVWMYSRELPNYMSKNWIDSIFAGARHVDEHINSTGSKYYTVKREAKKKISEYYRKHFYLYKDEFSNTLEDVKQSMEDSVRKYGCKLFIIDNLTAINLDCSDADKWGKQVDFVNYCIQFAQKYHVVLLLVIHPKKIETYRRLTKFDVQGLGSIVDLAHRLFSLYRVQKKEKEDLKDPVKFDVILDILKDRMRGCEGLEIGMYYDNASRRFYTNEDEYSYQYSWDDNIYDYKLSYPKKDEIPFT